MKLTTEQHLRLRLSSSELRTLDAERESIQLRIADHDRKRAEHERAQSALFAEIGLTPPFQIAPDGTVLGPDGKPLPEAT